MHAVAYWMESHRLSYLLSSLISKYFLESALPLIQLFLLHNCMATLTTLLLRQKQISKNSDSELAPTPASHQ